MEEEHWHSSFPQFIGNWIPEEQESIFLSEVCHFVTTIGERKKILFKITACIFSESTADKIVYDDHGLMIMDCISKTCCPKLFHETEQGVKKIE